MFTSIRDSKISRGCAKILEIPEGSGGKFWGPILENPEGRGVIQQIPSVGGMDIFWNHALFLNIYMVFAWIFICRLQRGFKKVSTKVSFSYQFTTILMDQLLCNVTLWFTSLFWWMVASTCILFTAFHLLHVLLFRSLLWSVIFFCSNLLSLSCNVGPKWGKTCYFGKNLNFF